MFRRARKILFWLTVALCVWLIAVGVRIWSFGNEDNAKPSDCIIVLGAAAYGAKPSPVFEERIRHALALFDRGLAPKLIFTGGFGGEGASHSESEVGANYAIAHGVPEGHVLLERASHTTWENMTEAEAIMRSNGLTTAIVVSDPMHLLRASVMAEDAGIEAVTSPTPTTRYRSFQSKAGFLLRELVFYHHHVILGG